MLGCSILEVSLLLFLPSMVALQSCPSGGIPGMPGIPGSPGYDGRNGQKGEKGDPGTSVRLGPAVGQKGQKGEAGIRGKSGKIGRPGMPGPVGPPGLAGLPGDAGESSGDRSSLVSAFSARRATDVRPDRGTPVRFTTVITNINNDYNVDSGKFVCAISGTYYFTYHTSSSTKNLCIHLLLDGVKLAGFCDHLVSNHPQQVSSGGLAVYVKKGQQVWLETDVSNGMYASGGKGDSVFSGFLFYAH